MPREKELYRDNLERVIAKFPEREIIPLKDAADWLGIDQRALQRIKDTPAKRIGGRWYVVATALASWMS